MRYYIYLSQKQQDIQEIHSKAIQSMQAIVQAAAKSKQKQSDNLILTVAEGDCPVQEASVKESKNDQTVQDLQFTVHREGLIILETMVNFIGMYYLYMFLNEQLIKNIPVAFGVQRSPEQEEKEQKEEVLH